MAKKITLTEGFRNIEEGEDKRLLIKKVSYDEKFQKCKVTFADADGATCTENFNFLKEPGKPNEVALGIFSAIYKCAMGAKTGDEVNPEDMQGRHVIADAFLQEYQGRQYIHLRNFRPDPSEEPADDADYDDLFS